MMYERYHGLDALRAVAMLLGIVLHAVALYDAPSILADRIGKPLPPPPSGHWDLLEIWIRQWRMPVFFLLAGFFAAMVTARKGLPALLADRAIRILGGFVLSMALISLVTTKSQLHLYHLWFLWFLIQFYAVTALAQWIGLGALGKPFLWIYENPWRLGFLLLPMMPLVAFAKSNFLYQVIPQHIMDFKPQGLIYYYFFFLLGIGLWHGRALLGPLSERRCWGALLSISVVAMLAVVRLGAWEARPDWLYALGVSLLTLTLSFGFIGMAQGLIRQSGPVLRFLVESSYAVYIVHIYMLLRVEPVFIELGFSDNLVIPLTIVATTLLSLIFYVVFIRYTPLDWVLAGPRNARFRMGRSV